MSSKLFSSKEIPNSLWDPTFEHNRKGVPKGKLKLPNLLEDSYQSLLARLDLIDQVPLDDNGEPGSIGDSASEEPHEHFAKRFSGSCGRVQLFMLDPHDAFNTTRQELIRLFSGGKVCILDIPFGAGAASFALMCLIDELRNPENAVIPCVDLDVEIVGGELSEDALSIAHELVELLHPHWVKHGLNVSLQTLVWDVLDDLSTAQLVEKWKSRIDHSTRPVIVVSSFSGFLGSAIKEGEARRQIHEAESCLRRLFVEAISSNATILWVEPSTRIARDHVISRLLSLVNRHFKKMNIQHDGSSQSQSFLRNPVHKSNNIISRAVGLHIT